MTLPLLLSVPHAGTGVPRRLAGNCLLSEAQVARDGDEFAAEIYAPLETGVRYMVRTDVARAVLDMNRAEDDLRKDGVVKTHSCWDEPVWKRPLGAKQKQWLLETYHRPYHRRLSELARDRGLLLAIDCHTMAEYGPPVGPDPAAKRPQACLGNANGRSCPDAWTAILQRALQTHFPGEVTVNRPFSGGYITRFHGTEMPWIQLELSRGAFASPEEKSRWVAASLEEAAAQIAGSRVRSGGRL
ncbi:MAG: N-formylglutamate amidohydrolase [Xanthomonadales bacterium]|nr:N-formylglutamate amidohydrolase [Xanthomonadales bacterium]